MKKEKIPDQIYLNFDFLYLSIIVLMKYVKSDAKILSYLSPKKRKKEYFSDLDDPII